MDLIWIEIQTDKMKKKLCKTIKESMGTESDNIDEMAQCLGFPSIWSTDR